MQEDPALRNHAKVLLGQIQTLRQLGIEGAKRPPPSREGPAEEDRGYWIVPAESDTTVIAFTGEAMRLDISIYFMQRLLKRQAVNVIYVFDWSKTYYFAGVKGLGENTGETVRGLRRLCKRTRNQASNLLRAVLRRLRGDPLRSKARRRRRAVVQPGHPARHEGADSRRHRSRHR